MNTFDVVVVGARLAGAATAMLLARRGLRVVLLDRSRPGVDTLSTHAMMRPGVLQLQRWGLLDRVRAAGTPPVHRTTFTYENAVVSVDIEPSDGVDALYAPRRTVLDPIVVDAAHQAGADVRFGYAVGGLLRDADGRACGVTGSGADGRPFRIHAGFVVGADGVRSSIARLVEAPVEHLGQHTSAITYGYWSGTDVRDYEWVFVTGASGGAMPTNDGRTCVWVSTTPGRIGRGGVEVIESILRASAPKLAGRLAEGQPPANTRTWHGQVGYLRRAWGAGWALVGDAGYFKDPLSAHGMTDALRDAELLARAITAVRAGQEEVVALAEYQTMRDVVSVPMFEIVDRIASHQWTAAEIARLLKYQARLMRDEADLVRGLDHSPQGDGHAYDERMEPNATRYAA